MIISAFLRKVKKKIEELGGAAREKLKNYECTNPHENASQNPILIMKQLTDKIT